jgi:nicotinamide-nucleotide adenylyltransferase
VISRGVRGLLVGRFQPFHLGHLGVIRSARAASPDAELLLVIGSAESSYTWENPFTAGERFEMAVRACREAGVGGVSVVPVEDIHRHTQWVAYLAGMLPKFETVYTNNPLTRLLFERAGYAVIAPPWVDRARCEGAAIRRRLAVGETVADAVPPSVAPYLEEIHAAERLRMLRPTNGEPSRT